MFLFQPQSKVLGVKSCIFHTEQVIPAILLFPPIWGLDGVWLAQPFSDFIAAVTAWGFLWYHVKNVKIRVKDELMSMLIVFLLYI